MFDATTAQKQAFQHATNNLSMSHFSHTILFMTGAIATIWLFMVFMGTIKKKEKSSMESMYEFSWAVFLFILVGVVIYYVG